MGRKLRGASMRAEKRSKLAAKELVDISAQQVQQQHVSTKTDEDLFVIDTEAVLPSKQQLDKKVRNKKKASNAVHKPSTKETAQIVKLVQTHSAAKLEQLVQAGKSTARRAKIKGNVKPTFDLWGDEPSLKDEDTAIEKTKNSKGRPSKKKKPNPKEEDGSDPVIGSTMAGTKPSEHVQITTRPAMPAPVSKDHVITVDVAQGGQSYNPDRVLHNSALKSAVQIEEKRKTAEVESKAPISTGMSDETKALLVGDSDSEESDSDEDNDGNEEDLQPLERQTTKKLTRAERNKQKRLRAEQKEIETRKRQKKIQNSVAEARNISKQLKRRESELHKRREEVKKLKEANQRTKGSDVYQRLSEQNPINAPTYPVALRSELQQTGGSLRTIKPKGSLITDRMMSLADRDMTAKKQLKKRKRVQGKRRKVKVKVRGKGYAESKEGAILG